MTESAYTSRIIKASALIPDTKTVLAEWDLEQSVEDNLERMRQENIFGKTSRMRVEDVLRIFRQRFFDDPDVGTALVTLTQHNAPSHWIDPLLYFFSAQNDRTLRAAVVEVLYGRQKMGYVDIPIDLLTREVRNWVTEGKTTTRWGDETVERVAQGIAATLRDFGVLEGAANKRLTPIILPTEAFALIAFWINEHEASGNRTLQSDEWKLFFLSTEGVERFFIEAHQQHLLSYHAAGSVIRVEFPAESLTEYAHVLLGRAY